MPYNVFLSHTAIDAPWVKWIAKNAKSIGIDVYIYEHDLQPGTILADKVKNAIRISDALVVLVTMNSQYTPYVHQEIGVAEGAGKLVIPLVQPGIHQGSLAMLQGREYILFDFTNPGPSLSTLLQYMLQLKKAKEDGRAALLAIGGLIVVALLAGKN